MSAPASKDKGPIKVLFVANDPPGGAVTRYRCENIAAALPADRFRAEVAYVGAPRVRVDHDIVVLHRICDVYEGRRFLAAARACGAAVVYGADDLVFEKAAFDENEPEQARFRQFAERHQAMLRAADAALVSTEFLAERARSAAGGEKPFFTSRNFLSDDVLKLSATASAARTIAPSEKVTLGYFSGTPTHNADLATIAASLSDALRRFPNAELLLVGPIALPKVLEPLENRVRRHAFALWEMLPEIYASIDINLAPLDLGRVFNHAKSEIKFLEAGAVGVPTLCADSAGFREALGETPGLADLLAASSEDWKAKLTSLIGDSALRIEQGRRAYRYVLTQGTSAGQRDRIVAAFDMFTRLHSNRVSTARRGGSTVNWPFSPKFALKHALRRLGSGI